MNVTEPIDPSKNPPIVTIDVPKKSMDALNGLEPKKGVKVVIEGEVIEVTRRDENEGFIGFPGTLRVEVKSISTMLRDNSFAELSEEDD